MTHFYSQEYFDTDEGLDILVSDGIQGLINAKIQSRHVSAKQYKFNDWHIASVKQAQELLECVVTSAVLYDICQSEKYRYTVESFWLYPRFYDLMLAATLNHKSRGLSQRILGLGICHIDDMS